MDDSERSGKIEKRDNRICQTRLDTGDLTVAVCRVMKVEIPLEWAEERIKKKADRITNCTLYSSFKKFCCEAERNEAVPKDGMQGKGGFCF